MLGTSGVKRVWLIDRVSSLCGCDVWCRTAVVVFGVTGYRVRCHAFMHLPLSASLIAASVKCAASKFSAALNLSPKSCLHIGR